jgi:hypothetical protein
MPTKEKPVISIFSDVCKKRDEKIIPSIQALPFIEPLEMPM